MPQTSMAKYCILLEIPQKYSILSKSKRILCYQLDTFQNCRLFEERLFARPYWAAIYVFGRNKLAWKRDKE